MNEDRFLEQLRADARSLRYEPDDVTRARLAARVRAELEPGTSGFLAAWFRPLAASLSIIGLAAILGLTFLERDVFSFGADPVEVSVAGDVYSVAE